MSRYGIVTDTMVCRISAPEQYQKQFCAHLGRREEWANATARAMSMVFGVVGTMFTIGLLFCDLHQHL